MRQRLVPALFASTMPATGHLLNVLNFNNLHLHDTFQNYVRNPKKWERSIFRKLSQRFGFGRHANQPLARAPNESDFIPVSEARLLLPTRAKLRLRFNNSAR